MDKQAFASALPSGTVLREYVIEAAIGQGGFGVVYRARHRYLDTLVALKEYLPAMVAVRAEGMVCPHSQSVTADYEEGLRRFIEEARRLVQFRSHPGVVTCIDFFEERGTAYLAMEYEDGLPLSELLMKREADANPLSEEELLRLAEQLLESLTAVHEAGVLHRDIKPSNILVRRSDERPVLIDFGAAKTDFARHTKSNAPRTQGYAAIEQVEEDGDLGPWTDLYGLGAVLWRIVAGGRRPHQRLVPVDASSRLAAKFRGHEDPQPSAWKLGSERFSRGVLDAVDKCLELEPKDRPADCGELLALLPIPARGDLFESRETNEAKEDTGIEAKESETAAPSPLEFGIDRHGRSRVLADQGHLYSPKRSIIFRGKGVPTDLEVAAEWYRKAADQGHAKAQYELGFLYLSGNGVPADFKVALEWYRKAADNGDPQAQYWLAEWLAGRHLYPRPARVPNRLEVAADLYRKAADQGHAGAQASLGAMYYRGEGLPKDFVLAAKWNSKAADQGNAGAELLLGEMHYRGKGVPKNLEVAAELFRKAAERGNARAQASLGALYYRGEGVPENLELAAEWCRKASDQGYALAKVLEILVLGRRTFGLFRW